MEKSRTEAFVVDILLYYGFSLPLRFSVTLSTVSYSVRYLRLFNSCVFNSYNAYG